MAKRMGRIIVCGFPGVGKSIAAQKYGWQDSDSRHFSWGDCGRNSQWPMNYVGHLCQSSGIVLASTHQEVREALSTAGARFLVFYPRADAVTEYLERYRMRGNSKDFICVVRRHWHEWIQCLDTDPNAVARIEMEANQHLSDLKEVVESFAR